jgi:hypothetical protein
MRIAYGHGETGHRWPLKRVPSPYDREPPAAVETAAKARSELPVLL